MDKNRLPNSYFPFMQNVYNEHRIVVETKFAESFNGGPVNLRFGVVSLLLVRTTRPVTAMR